MVCGVRYIRLLYLACSCDRTDTCGRKFLAGTGDSLNTLPFLGLYVQLESVPRWLEPDREHGMTSEPVYDQQDLEPSFIPSLAGAVAGAEWLMIGQGDP